MTHTDSLRYTSKWTKKRGHSIEVYALDGKFIGEYPTAEPHDYAHFKEQCRAIAAERLEAAENAWKAADRKFQKPE